MNTETTKRKTPKIYIKKVVGDFESLDFEETINELSAQFSFMYIDGTLFLAPLYWEEMEQSEELINKIFRKTGNFFIEGISEKNLDKQQAFIKDWCINHSVRLEEERFNAENQDRLKATWQALDAVEADLKKYAEENLAKGNLANLANTNVTQKENGKEVNINGDT